MFKSLLSCLASCFDGVSSTDGSLLVRLARVLVLLAGFLVSVVTSLSSPNNDLFVFFSASVEIRLDRRGSEVSEPDDGSRLRLAGFTSLLASLSTSSDDCDIASNIFFVETLRGEASEGVVAGFARSNLVD